MAWSSTSKAQPSTLRQLLPLIIIFAILGVGAWIGYHIYLGVSQVRESAAQRMGSKNVVFTKDGVRVGVKHVQNEKYVDATQRWAVKAWNLGVAKEDEQLKKKH